MKMQTILLDGDQVIADYRRNHRISDQRLDDREVELIWIVIHHNSLLKFFSVYCISSITLGTFFQLLGYDVTVVWISLPGLLAYAFFKSRSYRARLREILTTPWKDYS